jgi:hypothetical protein
MTAEGLILNKSFPPVFSTSGSSVVFAFIKSELLDYFPLVYKKKSPWFSTMLYTNTHAFIFKDRVAKSSLPLWPAFLFLAESLCHHTGAGGEDLLFLE